MEYIYNSIVSTIGIYNSESGGILGSKEDIITHYVFDRVCHEQEYIPRVEFLNNEIRSWNEKGVNYIGLIHSHKSRRTLSYADIEYARNIINLNNIPQIHMFLFVLDTKELIDYIVYENDVCIEEINIIKENN